MWKFISRSFCSIASQWQKDFRGTLGKARMMNNEQLLEVASKVVELNPVDIVKMYGKEEYLLSYFKTLTNRIKTMQNDELVKLITTLKENVEFRNAKFTSKLWMEIASELEDRADRLTFEQCIEVAHTFCFIPSKSENIPKLYKAINKVMSVENIENIRHITFNQLEDLLWAYSFQNQGSTYLYSFIADAMRTHPDYEKLTFSRLAKIASFFSRAKFAAQKGGFGINSDCEKKIWTAIHQGQMENLDELIEVVHFLLLNNIGDNKLHAVLEVKLYDLLTKPTTIITAHKLERLVSSLTHYTLKYSPLDKLLKQLIKDGLDLFSLKELSHINWSYSRHNKANPDFYKQIIHRIQELLSNTSEKSLSYRNYSYLLTGFLNAGVKDDYIWTFFEKMSDKYVNHRDIKDFYLLQMALVLGSIDKGSEAFYKDLSNELKKHDRLPGYHPKDIMRTSLALFETPLREDKQLIDFMDDKIFESSHSMAAMHMSNCAYAFARLNRGTPELYELLEKRMLDQDLTKLAPKDLGAACVGFGIAGRSTFCKSALFAINKVISQHSNREFALDDDSDTEPEDEKAPVVVFEKEIEFSSHFSACSMIQMCWLAAASGVKDNQFWSSKILQKLDSIPLDQSMDFKLNEWYWTAKAAQNDEGYFTSADSFHFMLLLQTLAMMPPTSIEFKRYLQYLRSKFNNFDTKAKMSNYYNFHNDRAFLDSVHSIVKQQKPYAQTHYRNILYQPCDIILEDNHLLLLYSQSHYIYMSSGWETQQTTEDLLMPYRFNKEILLKQGYLVHEICKGEWDSMELSQKQDRIKNFIEEHSKLPKEIVINSKK